MPQSFSGIVSGALAFGSDLVVIKPRRSIGTFAAQVTLEESHSDQLEISDHPVQQGASITDHAYKRPAELTIKCGWSNSPASASALGGVIGAATAKCQLREARGALARLQVPVEFHALAADPEHRRTHFFSVFVPC